ncbi:Serine threonine- phosphatase 6 regulatory ankyrin repeat subunit B [Fusarium albosuccineum]|uniref:Serine threonine- phosphatase 6 regulatory ankyrin repeat subunit B n=1 Tax=Fusarium albosuccineum TaxID=1237068 RepID=A0A8H4LLU7_9HYPO|nr:Serine threonine- phosphatase 6 regulatory ankyrin repeat subunit B [Fusarium albosuccineum]
MAEVVGLVVGIAPIAVNVIGGIDKLREIRQRSIQAPADLDFLLEEPSFLGLVLQQASSVPHFINLPGFQHCRASCDAVAQGIDDLSGKVPSASTFDERNPKWKDTWNLRHWKQDVDELKRSVEKAKQDLSLGVEGPETMGLFNQSMLLLLPPHVNHLTAILGFRIPWPRILQPELRPNIMYFNKLRITSEISTFSARDLMVVAGHAHLRTADISRFLRNDARNTTTLQYMKLLEIMTKYGFDSTTLDSPRTIKVSGCSAIQKQMLNINTGFAGMTPLHEAVLFQPLEMSRYWCDRSENNERNFLGQTPLHLAVAKLEHLKLVLDAGHDPNSMDADGTTPLMYAAALNQVRAAQMLLYAGANPSIRDSRFNHTFVFYAVYHENWQLIIVVLRQVKMTMGEAIVDVLAREALTRHFMEYRFNSRQNSAPYDQEVSAKEIGSLLKHAMLYDRNLFDCLRKDARGKEEHFGTQYRPGFDIDFKNDQFIPRSPELTNLDPIIEIAADISSYTA